MGEEEKSKGHSEHLGCAPGWCAGAGEAAY